MSAHRIAVVAFDHITPFHLSVPCLVFGDLGPGAELYELRVCASAPGALPTTAGFALQVEHGLEALAWAQTIIVPSWHDPDERPPQALLDALVAAHARGARLVGLCLGAYVLAEVGLLDGLRATTHWAWASDFAARFPRVTVDADVLYLDDGGLLTSAGPAAGIDCCLHLLRQQHGAELANRVARRRWCRRIARAGRRSSSSSRCRPPPATIAWPACWTGCAPTSTCRTAWTAWPSAR